MYEPNSQKSISQHSQSDYLYDSYSSESDQERANFIINAKKLIEAKIANKVNKQQQPQQLFDPREDLQFYYNGAIIDGLPAYLNGIENFAQIVKANSDKILQSLTTSDRARLQALMPQSFKDKDKALTQIIKSDSKIGTFGQSPIESFGSKLQNNTFTKPFQQYMMFKKQLQLINEKERILRDIEELENTQRREQIEKTYQLDELFLNLLPPRSHQKNQALSHSSLSSDSSEMSEEEKEIYDGMHAEDDDLTSGYTTISSNQNEFIPRRQPQLNKDTLKAFSVKEAAGIKDDINPNESSANNKNNDNPKLSANQKRANQGSDKPPKDPNATSGKGSRSKTLSFLDPNSIAAQNFQDKELLDQIFASERFKELRNIKNQLPTLPQFSDDQIKIYQQQEEIRYQSPSRPWIYLNDDGSTSIVGPVVKKKNQSILQKPRDHPQLHSSRPAIVTLLCLARDAASRLPDGIGTRGDIIELIKHSQWLKIDTTDANTLNTVISGALDRLHYEEDSCVKYDADKKLWIYMHAKRTLDYPEWRHSLHEAPNSLAENSFNPYFNTERENDWNESKHKGSGIIIPEPANEQSENIEIAQQQPQPKQSSLIQIRIGGGGLDFSKNKQL